MVQRHSTIVKHLVVCLLFGFWEPGVGDTFRFQVLVSCIGLCLPASRVAQVFGQLGTDMALPKHVQRNKSPTKSYEEAKDTKVVRARSLQNLRMPPSAPTSTAGWSPAPRGCPGRCGTPLVEARSREESRVLWKACSHQSVIRAEPY